MEGTKIVVFGMGGAGCKIVGRLAEKPVDSTTGSITLIAIDKDAGLLGSLSERIKKIAIGGSIAGKGESFDEIKSLLSAEISTVEAPLDGTEMAIAIAGLGGKTGTFLSDYIIDLCAKRGMPVLFIPIYPLLRTKGAEGADSVIRNIRGRVDGIIVVDSNLKMAGGKLPMLKVFNCVNDVVVELVALIIASVSGACSTNLSKDELLHFFYGDLFFVLTSGRAINLENAGREALSEVGKYSRVSDVKRVLVLVSSPTESLSVMKRLNGIIQDKLNPDSIAWISAQAAGETSVFLVSAVSELPIFDITRVTGAEQQEQSTATSIKKPAESASAVGTPPDEFVELTEQLEKGDESLSEGTAVSETIDDAVAQAAGRGPGGEGANQDLARQLARGDDLAVGEGADLKATRDAIEGIAAEDGPIKQSGKKEDSQSGRPEGGVLKVESLDTKLPYIETPEAKTKDAGHPEKREKDLETPFKRQALIGIKKTGIGVPTRRPPVGKREEKLDDYEDVDDLVNELVNIPGFKKKGQKKLGDYEDDLGIEFI